MNYFQDLIEQSLVRAREATLSVLGISDSDLRCHLAKSMSDDLGAEGCFLAPPVFEHTFGWEESSESLAELEGSLLSPTLLSTLQHAHAYKFPQSARPYTHQLKAWNALLARQPKSVVITSGTGSGKTECFMVPILEDLIREYDRRQKPLVGVRALFLYPLNALINSQQERLDAWTRHFDGDIRFCLYNGKTEESAGKARKDQREKSNQVLSRQLMREEPAPILMTNATMLEYMLVRQADQPILDISREEKSLRWIVLDEAHTYIGSQAAELSLLLRRVMQAFGKRPEEIRFVATSATIADSDADERLREYLSSLAGVPLEQVDVIGGSRVVPDLVADLPEQHFGLSDIQDIDSRKEVSQDRYQALSSVPTAQLLRCAIVSSPKPLDLNDLLLKVDHKLESGPRAAKQREVLRWLDVMSGTRPSSDEPPFLKLRIHLFQRMLHGLWSCVDPTCHAKSNDLHAWPFGNVYVSQRTTCSCGGPVFELGFCNECREPHLLAEVSETGKVQQCSLYAGDEFSLSYDEADDYASNDHELSETRKGITRKLFLTTNTHIEEPYMEIMLDLDSLKLGVLGAARSLALGVAFEDEGEGCCSRCGYAGKEGANHLRMAYLGSPFYVANAVPTVLEFCPDPEVEDLGGNSAEELPARGRRLITFTDSRQGTARMAVRMQQEAERSRLRGLVFELLRNGQAKMERGPQSNPSSSYETLMEGVKQLERLGLVGEAANLREQAVAKKASVVSKVYSLKWQNLIEELSATKAISLFILDYNKYANPQVFGDYAAASTMARLLLAREYSRRPKNQNSTETLALVRVGYDGLESICTTPSGWTETLAFTAHRDKGKARTLLSIQDWRDFLKVALDFYVRENTFIRLDPALQRWMGSRFSSKALFSPDSLITESAVIKKWPQANATGPSHRLVKLLEEATGFDRTNSASRDLINLWLTAAWTALTQARILEQVEQGFSLSLRTLTFSLPQEAWVCPITRRMFDTTFRGLTPYLPRRKRLDDYRCEKVKLPHFNSLSADGSADPKVSQVRKAVAKDDVVRHLRAENLWTDLSDRTVEGGFYYRTAEHSAQQSANRLENYEEKFKRGKINVLNCSTTMEMGVDIGGISAVVMNNVPPHPANYLQRAGRAGRRNEARAIAYTLCKADPHNQRVFRQPKWPFQTAIPAPRVTLSSERIVLRHVNSLLLSIFLQQHTANEEDRIKLNLKWFFGGENSSVARRFIDWLQSEPTELKERVWALTKGTALAGRSLSSVVQESVGLLRGIERRWVAEHQKLVENLAAASDEPYKKALGFELERHEKEYLLRDLAVRAFLPGYGFPTDVVSLKTYNVEDFRHKKYQKEDKTREDNIFSSKELPTRALDIAIREYAPGAQIVIDGRVYRSAGVSLHWHSGGAKNEAQKFDLAWRCDQCGAVGVVENAYSNDRDVRCTHCEHNISLAEKKLVLRPAGFVTDFYEPTTNDVTSQKYIRVERPRIQLNGEVLALPDPRCGHIHFGHEGSVFYHSSGEHEKGYAICLSCGRTESMLANGEVPTQLKPDKNHRPVGGAVGSHKEKDCSGSGVKSNIYLGYQTQTDVLEVFLRSPKTGQWLSDSPRHQVIAMTFAVALRDVIAEQQGIVSTEMGFGIRLDKDLATGAKRSVIQLFDQVSGGAGFVLAGLADITTLLRKATSRLDCVAHCESICSSCLASQDSRVELEELDRKGAQTWLIENEFLDHLVLPAEFSRLPDATYCSFEPQRFIRSAINRGATSLKMVLSGNPEEWDLDVPAFRDRVLTWSLIDGLQVSLGISEPEAMPRSVKRSLGILSRFGIQVFKLDEAWSEYGVPAVVQVGGAESCQTLFAKSKDVLVPGEYWLVSSQASIWASSNVVKPFSERAIATDGWEEVASGASVLEVTSELNGLVNGLSERLLELWLKELPDLGALIKNDHAISVHYSDRYLRSPWSIMLVGAFLSIFKNKELASLEVETVKPASEHSKFTLRDDWSSTSDLVDVMQAWLEATVGIFPKVSIKEKAFEVQHGRVISVEWASGKRSRIILDQGVGYWRPRMPHAADLNFDFYESVEQQALQLLDKYRDSIMLNGGSWPTFITVEMK